MRSCAVAVLLLVLGSGLAACTGDEAEKPRVEPTTTTPTPLAAFDTRAVTLARADFCGLIPESAAEQALGAKVATRSDYGNGQRAVVSPGVRDVAHEYSCSYATADGATARAWVFAPRLTTRDARGLVRALRRERGCATPDAAAFGKPTVGTVCTSATGVEAAYHGLFVDAWLSCSVTRGTAEGTGAEAALLERAGEWCVQVAAAVDTSAD